MQHKNTGRQGIAAIAAIVLSATALTGCSTPPADATAPPPPALTTTQHSAPPRPTASPPPQNQQAEIDDALQHMWRNHYYAAEENLRKLVEAADIDGKIRRKARAALVLLYLDKDNPRYSVERATRELDNLYLSPRNDNDESLLFGALKAAVENALQLSEESKHRQIAERQSRKLEQDLIALQIALEKLRKLSLQ